MKQFSRAIIMILSTLEKQNVQAKGPNVWLFRGVWVISEKKYPADWFRGEKILARRYLAKKKILHRKNISFMEYNAWKNLTPLYVRKKILSQAVSKKKILTQIKSPIPLLKKSNGRPLNR